MASPRCESALQKGRLECRRQLKLLEAMIGRTGWGKTRCLSDWPPLRIVGSVIQQHALESVCATGERRYLPLGGNYGVLSYKALEMRCAEDLVSPVLGGSHQLGAAAPPFPGGWFFCRLTSVYSVDAYSPYVRNFRQRHGSFRVPAVSSTVKSVADNNITRQYVDASLQQVSASLTSVTPITSGAQEKGGFSSGTKARLRHLDRRKDDGGQGLLAANV